MNKTYKMILCALFAALAAIGAFIKIPTPLVPITLQLLFTLMAGIILGSKLGAISVGSYVLIGLLGIPVFTGGGGPSYVLQTSFGYILGFVLGAFVAGLIAEKGKPTFVRFLIASLAGLLAVYMIGVPYFYFISKLYLKKEVAVGELVLNGFLIFLPGDILKCVICAFLGKRLVPIVRKRLAKKTANPA